jgi:hypothetical protein
MATRSQIEFYDSKIDLDSGNFCARVYHHWDGYPSSRLLDIKKAIDTANVHYKGQAGFSYRQTVKDFQFPYMGDLAAFYIVANKDGAGNVEIDNMLHSDIEFLYQIYPGKSGFKVRILEPKNWEKFWDNPKHENMKKVADGTLESLLKKYAVEDEE